MAHQNDLQDVGLARQYEVYPYPERDLKEETKRLLIGSPSHLNEIDYWVFGGFRSPSQPLRILIAGCGTGDAAIMVAQQMTRNNRPGKIICLDRAEAVLKIVKARAAIRKLNNIQFVQGSILDLPNLNLGTFDYIDCCGVLHHLPDPILALQILKTQLNSGGGMGLMVYAPYGRTGVYMLQEALSELTSLSDPPAKRLDVAKRIMKHLPETAWLRFNSNFGDHLTGSDAGLYDLLLNPRDRAYKITELWDLLDQTGFAINGLIEPARYNPTYLITDPRIREKFKQLDIKTRAGIAESLAGNMSTHVVYVRRAEDTCHFVDPCSMDSIPFMREIPGEILANQILSSNLLPYSFGMLTIMLPLPPQARGFLGLVNNQRSIGEIVEIVKNRGVETHRVLLLWKQTFDILRSINQVFVKSAF